jgi:small subunit ribosomal protein S8
MDPISNMFSQIKNALAVKETAIKLPYSKMKASILSIFKKEGFILDFKEEKVGEKKLLHISLKYNPNKEPAISSIKRVSKPGLRIYRSYTKLHSPLQGLGLVIISTSQGIVTDIQARRRKIGGEVICEIY